MKEDTREALEKMENLAGEIERNPLTKKLRAEEAAETLAKRKAAAAKITALQKEQESHVALQGEIDSMIVKLGGLDAERAKMTDEINQRRYRLRCNKTGLENEIRQQTEILFSTYDTAIDAGIEFFRERFDELRKRTVNSQKQAESTIETKTITTFSDVGSIRRALAYCTVAIQKLEGMRLEPVFDPAKVERLRAEEPDADLLEEFSATKRRHNDEARPGLLSAMRQATDDLSDLTVGTLLEKAKKILAPKRARA